MTSLLVIFLAFYNMFSKLLQYAACNVCVEFSTFPLKNKILQLLYFISLNINYETMYMQINLKQRNKVNWFWKSQNR